MKKLQYNFTTTEQSKRLLDLGLPAYSADCYFTESGKIEIKNTAFDILYTPCWSVGQLIEIYCILTDVKEFKMYTIDTLVEEIIYLLNAIKINGADFSKLEE